MPYTICNVVCGYEIPSKVMNFLDEIEGIEYCHDLGFNWLYSQSGHPSCYCGIITHSFTECKNIYVCELIPHLTPKKQDLQFAKQIMENSLNKFSTWLDEYEDDEGKIPFLEKCKLLESLPEEPSVILMWSSS